MDEKPDADGNVQTLRHHYESLERRGIAVAELHICLPSAIAYLRGFWNELNIGRKASPMGGACQIDWTDLAAWQQATRRSLSPVELGAVMRIERTYWSVMKGSNGV